MRAIRYRQGRDSARGYYEDAYNFEALADRVLRPLGPGGSLIYARRVHDLATDEVVNNDNATADRSSIVIFDCTSVQRDALRDLWDEVIFLEWTATSRPCAGSSARRRSSNGALAAQAVYESRYMAAGDIYLTEQRPVERASIVINNNDVDVPVLVRAASTPWPK